jgi:hypothetical protein
MVRLSYGNIILGWKGLLGYSRLFLGRTGFGSEISGSHGGEYEDESILRYSAV